MPPAEVISKVTVARIQNHTPIKARRVQHGLILEKLLPVKDIGGGELGGHMGHEFTARGESRGNEGRWKQRDMKRMCNNHNPLLLPGPPLEPSGAPLENKAELITLPIGNDNVLQLLHHRAGAPAHQAQGSVIIWLCEFVLLCKPAMKYKKKYNKTKVKGVRLCMKPLKLHHQLCP